MIVRKVTGLYMIKFDILCNAKIKLIKLNVDYACCVLTINIVPTKTLESSKYFDWKIILMIALSISQNNENFMPHEYVIFTANNSIRTLLGETQYC